MTLIADSGGLYALYDRSDRYHQAVKTALEREPGPIVIPQPILAEVDYLLGRFLGIGAELAFLGGIRAGEFRLEAIVPEDLDRAYDLIDRYRNLDLGLADSVVMATAERLGTLRALTVDERDFRSVVTARGERFLLVPQDVASH